MEQLSPCSTTIKACGLESRNHNYQILRPRARALQQEKPLQREACALRLEEPRQQWKPGAAKNKLF